MKVVHALRGQADHLSKISDDVRILSAAVSEHQETLLAVARSLDASAAVLRSVSGLRASKAKRAAQR